ncbi:unnamed protein product [Oreochromis niloticus]|nr:unnamed protein product [Mustela putorius furo]
MVICSVPNQPALLDCLSPIFESWMKEFVSWDQVQFGTDLLHLPRTKFWLPDIVITEFMEEDKAPPAPYGHLHSNSKVDDAQPVKVVSSCNLDIYTFPRDIQNCAHTFNSYMHFARDIFWKIFLGRSAEKMTDVSKSVMATIGE